MLSVMLLAAQAKPSDAISIQASPLPVFDRSVPDNRYGPLTFLGGLVLTSSERRFQALSGLAIAVEGSTERLIIVTDEANWLTAELQRSPAGVPLALANAHIGPLLDSDGSTPLTKALADAEAVTLTRISGASEVWVSSERNQPVRAYALSAEGLAGAARLPLGLSTPLEGGRNEGIEAMERLTTGPLAGQTLVFLEEPAGRAGAPNAARILPSGQVIPFALRRMDGFAVTDAAGLENGDVILLERRFSWDAGLFMRLRLLSAQDILAGAVAGQVLLQADGASIIDNMEGVAVTPHPGGPILTLISDDNGNFFQRTVLMSFQITGALEEAPRASPPAPAPRPAL